MNYKLSSNIRLDKFLMFPHWKQVNGHRLDIVTSFNQLRLVACSQLLSSVLGTGQMTNISPQNLDELSENATK